MIAYDCEVYKHNWLFVLIDPFAETVTKIWDSEEDLKSFFESHQNEIWIGYNNKHYDQYILKGILLGINPKTINDQIIVEGREGWQISSAFNQIPMINYDVMPNPPIGLKTLEGFMGSNIKETDVPFDLDRPLTEEEKRQTEFYCIHDVEQTIEVFMKKYSDFDAMKAIVQAFPEQLTLKDVGDSEARITAKVMQCTKHEYNDEFNYFILPCIQIEKYKKVVDWFIQCRDDMLWRLENEVPVMGKQYKEVISRDFYKQSLTVDVAGVPHTFGFGGVHGAPEEPVHIRGAIYHVDVNNYYPSMLIAWDLVTRSAGNLNYTNVYNTRKQMKMKQLAAETKAEAKEWKRKQLPYKKMLNALSGAMKDKTNPAYDPRNNNIMCINGQLMLLDLIEHLEMIEGFRLVQANTDGIIVNIPDTDTAFEQLDDICWEWEQRCSTDKCSIGLALDEISEIYQGDVNNYLWIDADGGVERIGAYVKELSPIDNDLPIINKALVDYMVKKIPIEKTINGCNDLSEFQKVVKLSNKYKGVMHEEGEPDRVQTGKRIIKTHLEYRHHVKYTYKCYRVFASMSVTDGRLLKYGGSRGKPEKFGNTPDHCFVYNDSTVGVKVPDKLDKQWYIDLAKKRMKEKFGEVL